MNLRRSETFVLAVVPFDQIAINFGCGPEATDFAGASGALQRTREDLRERKSGQPFAKPAGIAFAAISGRLGENVSVKEGQEAARIASLNALAVAKEHLGDLDQLKKLVKLTVLIATTEQFTEHAPVADGASDLFVQIFGPEAGHTRLVYGVQSLPVGAPVIVETIFEIEPA